MEEGMLELPILGVPGNRKIPLREFGIQFPGTWIITKREFGKYYQTESGASGQEGYLYQHKFNRRNLEWS